MQFGGDEKWNLARTLFRSEHMLAPYWNYCRQQSVSFQIRQFIQI